MMSWTPHPLLLVHLNVLSPHKYILLFLFSSYLSSSIIAPFASKDVATTKINDPIISNLIQVPNKKRKKKIKWEVERIFQMYG